eukprot:6207790-Pleurochrysis_carterae.AAC.3
MIRKERQGDGGDAGATGGAHAAGGDGAAGGAAGAANGAAGSGGAGRGGAADGGGGGGAGGDGAEDGGKGGSKEGRSSVRVQDKYAAWEKYDADSALEKLEASARAQEELRRKVTKLENQRAQVEMHRWVVRKGLVWALLACSLLPGMGCSSEELPVRQRLGLCVRTRTRTRVRAQCLCL